MFNVYKPRQARLIPTVIPTFPHPGLYPGDFNCQHVYTGYSTTSTDDESLDSWATANNLELLHNKGSSQHISRKERRHQPGSDHRECRQWQPTTWQTYSRLFPRSQTTIFSKCHRGSKFLLTATRWSVGTIVMLVGIAFAFLQDNPLTDCHLRTQQTWRRHTRNLARACYLRLNIVYHVAVAA